MEFGSYELHIYQGDDALYYLVGESPETEAMGLVNGFSPERYNVMAARAAGFGYILVVDAAPPSPAVSAQKGVKNAA